MALQLQLAIFGFGAFLFLIGLLGKVQFMQSQGEAPNKGIRIAAIILGILIMFLPLLFTLGNHSNNSSNIELNNSGQQPASDGPSPPISNNRAPTVKPDQLIDIIKEQQRIHVKESFGVEAYQSYTYKDLEKFAQSRTPEIIAQKLKNDSEFIDIVLAIKQMPSAERQKLLELGVNTFKKTWAQTGKIDPAGQTEAGQTAEKMIAESIVNLVKELSKHSVEQIKTSARDL
jgi:hypothetical protein